STRGVRASPRQVLHEPPEFLAALLEVAELVVAGAGGRQQDDIAGAGGLGGGGDRRGEVPAPHERGTGPAEGVCELLRRLADQVGTAAELAGEVVEALALARSSENHVQRSVVGAQRP